MIAEAAVLTKREILELSNMTKETMSFNGYRAMLEFWLKEDDSRTGAGFMQCLNNEEDERFIKACYDDGDSVRLTMLSFQYDL